MRDLLEVKRDAAQEEFNKSVLRFMDEQQKMNIVLSEAIKSTLEHLQRLAEVLAGGTHS